MDMNINLPLLQLLSSAKNDLLIFEDNDIFNADIEIYLTVL